MALRGVGACVDGPLGARGLLHDLTSGAMAVICPASHEGVLVKLPHGVILQAWAPRRGFDIVQGRALVTAGASLQTSHPAGLRSHHCPAFGTGELQEDGTTLYERHSRAKPDNGDAPLDPWPELPCTSRLP